MFSYLFISNVKVFGVIYLLFSFIGGLMGFSMSMCISIELNNPFSVLGDYFYNVCLTSHGLVMLFYFLTIMIYGLYYIIMKNYLEIQYVSVMSSLSFFLYLISMMIMLISLMIGEGVNSAWTLYTPLTCIEFNDSLSLDFLILGLNLFLISSVLNFIQIFHNSFQIMFESESWLETPVMVWSFFLTSLLGLVSIPSLFSVLVLLILDSNFGTYFFNVEVGGSVMLFQTFFWIFGHPEVYLLILPFFGIVSSVLEVFCKGFLFNSVGMVFSKMTLFIISLLVFGHHMTTVGWGLNMKGFFMMSTLIMSLPTGVKVFSWLYSLILYGKSFSLVIGFMSLFLLFFSMGGVTGVFLANYSLDLFFHDSYFVVGHFHMILVGASMFGFLSGMFLMYLEILNFYSFSGFVKSGLWLTFFVIFSLGLLQLVYFLHLLGLVGTPSSVLLFCFENYVNLHLSSISFLSVWLSLFLIIFLILMELVN